MNKEGISKIYGKQNWGEHSFTAKARLLQSFYRVEIGEKEYGVGPNKQSKDKDRNFTRYGNMLVDGTTSGRNFLLPETFAYAKQRVECITKNETINEYRLFNNLLSSQPLAFNLFHPLMLIKDKYPDTLDAMIKSAFPTLPVHKVTDIRIEFVPEPIESYTNDKSAMDAAIEFIDDASNKYIIAIEVKYTDTLGINKASEKKLQPNISEASALFTAEGAAIIKNGGPQIYRNFLLTEKYRTVNNLSDSYSIILAPKANRSTEGEIDNLHKNLKPEFHYKLKEYAMEEFVLALNAHCPQEFQNWITSFSDRYLNFSKIAHLYR